MDKLGNHYQKTGISIAALRTWGMIFLAAGVLGRGVLQNRILGFGGLNLLQMLDVMLSSEAILEQAAYSLALQALETCAAPIFAMLLVQGMVHTSDFNAYFIRVLATALVTELPYNLVMGSGLLDLSGRNPMFALVLGMLLVFFYRRYPEKSGKDLGVKALLTLAAFAWVKMLSIRFGAPLLILILVLWALRNSTPARRDLLGAGAALACGLLSPYFLVSPLAFLAIHMCNWERGEENRAVNYLMYPGMLLMAFLVVRFLL